MTVTHNIRQSAVYVLDLKTWDWREVSRLLSQRFPVCIWCFQGREGEAKERKDIIDRLLSALHVQIAGLPPVRTVLVFYLLCLKTNLIC